MIDSTNRARIGSDTILEVSLNLTHSQKIDL